MMLILVSDDEEEEVVVLRDVEDYIDGSKQKLGVTLADQLIRSYRLMQIKLQEKEE